MRYIIYARVSTNLQDTDTQLQECLTYVESVKQPGDEVIRFDEPETSSRIGMDERVQLQEMLKFVKPGDCLVIYKLDRLARDGEELVFIYRSKLIKKGVKVVSLYEPHIDKANIHIYAFLAETERENVSLRTKSALKAKQNRMEKVGATWYGFRTKDDEPQLTRERARSFKKPYKLIPDDRELEAVQLMIELDKQLLSYQAIADELSAQGFLNRAGKPIHKMSVYRVLQNQGRYSQALAV